MNLLCQPFMVISLQSKYMVMYFPSQSKYYILNIGNCPNMGRFTTEGVRLALFKKSRLASFDRLMQQFVRNQSVENLFELRDAWRDLDDDQKSTYRPELKAAFGRDIFKQITG